MAHLAVAARNLDTGYEKGDLISVLPDGWAWGTLDTLPNIWRIEVTGLPTALVRPLVAALHEPALPGDKEFESQDEADRRVHRGRSAVRIMWDEFPGSWLFDLDLTGELTVRKNQLRPFMRRLRYNRGSARIEKSPVQVI